MYSNVIKQVLLEKRSNLRPCRHEPNTLASEQIASQYSVTNRRYPDVDY